MGALRVSFWGGIGAEAQGIRIGQASGFGADPFLSAEALRVHVQLLPLLRGRLKVTSAVLERPRLRVVHGPDGHWSVEDLFKNPSPQGPARAPAETARPGKAPLFGGLLVSEVAVRNGEIILVEHTQPAVNGLTLTDVDVTFRHNESSNPIQVESRARLAGAASGQLTAALQIKPGEKDGPAVDGTLSFTAVEAKDWHEILPGGPDGPIVSGAVSGEVRLTGPLARTAFVGSLDLTPTTLRLGNALRKAAGEEARITFDGQRDASAVRLTKITMAFRDTTLEGTADLADMRVPHISFTATSPRVNLDRLLAVPAKQKEAWLSSGVAWAAPAAPRKEASASAGHALRAQGRVNIGELSYQGLRWSAVEADVQYQDGIVRLPSVQAKFAQGKLRAHGEVDLRPRTPRVSLTSRLEKAATEPLVKALALGPWTLKSGLDFDGQVEFGGSTLPDILGSAVGSGSVQLVSGRLIDYRPLDRLAELVTPMLAAQGIRVRLNEFDQVNGHYTVDKGVVRTTDLTLTKPEGTVTAAGSLGLLDSAVDLDVVAKFGRSTIEAKVTGTTAQPIVILKLARLQRRIENELDKVLPEGQSQGLKDLLKGLFRR